MDGSLEPITRADVCRLLGAIADRTLSRMIADGAFPAGFHAGRGLGERWYRKDVEAYLWLQMRLARRPSPRKRRKSPPENRNP